METKEFVVDWLNHFNYMYQEDVPLNSSVKLDFLVDSHSLGIFIVDWKRPISVQMINKAIQLHMKFQLRHLYLIATQISEPATKTLERYGSSIITIHPNGLSELAIELAQTYQNNSSKAFS